MLISAKDIILQSWELYKKNYQLFLKYMLVLLIPAGIISIISAILGSLGQSAVNHGIGSLFLTYALIVIAASVVSFWISLSFIRVIAARYDNKKPKEIREELQDAVPLILPAIGATILAGLAILGGTILLIIPGIIFAVWFAFVIYAVALDNSKVVESLHTSKALVKGRWWAVLWRLAAPAILFGLLVIVAQSIIGWPLSTFLKGLQPGTAALTFVTVVYALLNVVISLLITPLSTSAPTILYLELKKTPVVPHEPKPEETAPEEPPV